MILCSKLKNGICKIVTKLQVVTKFNVTKSRLHCSKMRHAYKVRNSALSRTYAPCTLCELNKGLPLIITTATCNL